MTLFPNIPFNRINWTTSTFLIGTFLLAITAVPAYIWFFGITWFQIAFFIFMAYATGMSITLGYHRLFSHIAFQAKLPVRLFTVLFGAAAFENSVIQWASEHRRHHKHVDDHDDDPYAISRGFFYAHIGWLLFKLHADGPYDNVNDLKKDPLVSWQHRYVQWIGVAVGFVMPTVVGYLMEGPVGALGGFLISGVARVVAVQHCTFFINSACHTVGRQPYSAKCSARDSWIMALFTFGEGYHNYHHEFQHDYRNGVKPWQWDPTKWAIWLMQHVGLTSSLRRVPSEKILLAQIAETQRQLEAKLQQTKTATLPEAARALLQASQDYLQDLNERWAVRRREYVKATEQTLENSRDAMNELHQELKTALTHLKIVKSIESTR
jgi:stearoyl-CoA desaturase (delta-9 desaturase)